MNKEINEFKATPLYEKIKNSFPDAKLLNVKKIKISQKMNDFTKIISQAKEIEAKIKDSRKKLRISRQQVYQVIIQ